jgi:hypothetical protein
MPPNYNRPIKLEDILGPYLRNTGLSRRLEEDRILCLWPEIVGKAISANTRPMGIRNRVLQVKVMNSVWMQQLQFMKGIILQKINDQRGRQAIDDLKFFLGEIEKKDKEEQKTPVYPMAWSSLGKEEREKIEKEVGAIQDPEMREILARLFARGIQAGRRRTKEK